MVVALCAGLALQGRRRRGGPTHDRVVAAANLLATRGVAVAREVDRLGLPRDREGTGADDFCREHSVYLHDFADVVLGSIKASGTGDGPGVRRLAETAAAYEADPLPIRRVRDAGYPTLAERVAELVAAGRQLADALAERALELGG